MSHTLIFTGDVNLMNVTDPAQPFAKVAATLKTADVLFGNLECCLYKPPAARSRGDEGFYASPEAGQALVVGGFHAVGTANNVNYGAEAITASLAELHRLGIRHTGTGANREAARAPAIVESKGRTFGVLQRTSVYWPTNHEAGERSPGVAALRGHTAYQVPSQRLRPDSLPGNRPGVPPEVVTWADPAYLAEYRDEIAAVKRRCDVVVASHHWGLYEDVLQYMTEIAHAAIDSGADIVVGHGPHYALPVEIYRGKPIFYGLGSFSFHSGHRGKHGDWLGMLAKVQMDGAGATRVAFQFVRHNDANETILRAAVEEPEGLAALAARSARLATRLEADGDDVVARPAA